MSSGTGTTRITRSDLEAKFRQLQGDVEVGVESGRDVGRVAAIAGGVVALGVIYLVGRRHGRKKRTVVEITRI
jgi:hypothetical protein